MSTLLISSTPASKSLVVSDSESFMVNVYQDAFGKVFVVVQQKDGPRQEAILGEEEVKTFE